MYLLFVLTSVRLVKTSTAFYYVARTSAPVDTLVAPSRDSLLYFNACSQIQETVSYQQRKFRMFGYSACLQCLASGALMGRKQCLERVSLSGVGCTSRLSTITITIRRTNQIFLRELTQITAGWFFFPISASDNMSWMLLPFGKGLALPKPFGGREKKTFSTWKSLPCCFVLFQSSVKWRLERLANCLI